MAFAFIAISAISNVVSNVGFECHLQTTMEGYVSGFAVLHENMLPEHLCGQLFDP